MKIKILTLFPNIIKCYFEDSILKKAIEKNIINIELIDFRKYSTHKHKKVDTPLSGGGAGMIIDNQALKNALSTIKTDNSKIIFLTPVGKKFNQKDAIRFSKEKELILVAGRYEGFDERLIEEFADEVISIGDFILTGGEVAALIITDATVRHIDGVLGNKESLKEESFEDNLLESPNFSKDKESPLILKSGNHKLIKEWKKKLAYYKTKFHRPDLINTTISNSK